MGLLKRFRMLFRGTRHDFVPILAQQTDFLCKTSSLLVEMFGTDDVELRSGMEKEIKSCEAQGDALLTEFHEMLSARPFIQVNKLDLQAVAMAMDDCLDVIKDTSKAVLIYRPAKLDDSWRIWRRWPSPSRRSFMTRYLFLWIFAGTFRLSRWPASV